MDTRWIIHAFIITTFHLFYLASSETLSIESGFKRQLLQPGDNVTLHCTVKGQYLVPIIWLLDGLPLRYVNPQSISSIPLPLSADNPYRTKTGDSISFKYSITTSNEVSNDNSISNNDDVIDGDAVENGNVVNVERRTNESLNAIEATTVTPEAIELPSIPKFDEGVESHSLIHHDIPITGGQIVTVTSSLSLNNARVEDGGIYVCVARNVFGKTASWRGKIAVAGPLSLRQNRPIVALLNSVVILPCTVLGSDDDFPVKWYYQKFSTQRKNDGSVADSSASWALLLSNTRRKIHANGSLEIYEARKENEGVYSCHVELNDNTETMETSLKVMVPPKIKPFSWLPVRVGVVHSEMCVVTQGDPPLNIYWIKDGVMMRPNDNVEMTRSDKNPTLSLTINSPTLQSSGNYSCCASNNVTRTCSTSTLVVLDPPKIVNLLSTVSALSGNTVEIKCEATGYPKPNITWKRMTDESPSGYITIPVASTIKTPEGKDETGKILQNKDGSLIIVNVSTPDAGQYLCQAVNKVDESSKFVSLQVHNPARILKITKNRDVNYRDDVTIDCSIWGDDVINVTWTKNGASLDFDDRIQATKMDNGMLDSRYPITLSRLTITNTVRSDTASYTCHARNKYGDSKEDSDVIVRAPPMTPVAFAVIDRGTSFLRMVVSPGEDDGGRRLLKYELTYQKSAQTTDLPTPPEGRFTPATAPAKTTAEIAVTRSFLANGEAQEISLNELDCGAEYKMSVKAMNQIGTSFKAANVTASTIGTVPVLPAINEFVVFKNQSCIVLDLRSWQNGGCPITDLRVEFARHGDTVWNTTKFDGSIVEKALYAESEVGEDNGRNPGHFVLADLQVGTWYKVWSSACNVAGCNYFMHSLATLLADGQTVPPTDTTKEKTDSDDRKFLVPMICGFGLVFLLFLLLLLYRYKQRAKKVMRMKEARKMARTLLNTPNEGAPTVMTVEMPDNTGGSPDSPFLDTSVSITSDNNDSTMQVPDHEDGHCQSEPFTEDLSRELLDGLAGLPTSINFSTSSQTKGSECSARTKVSSEGRKSLKDNAELAVFQDMACSDDENLAAEPLNCDENAFGDSGTWSFFRPNVGADNARFAKPTPKLKVAAEPRRSSSSSGTDEEVARVFGMPSSKRKPNSGNERPVKSDLNDNYRPSPRSSNDQNRDSKPPLNHKNIHERLTQKRGRIPNLMQQEVRSNSTGMVQNTNPRHFRPVPTDVVLDAKRWNTAAHAKQNPAFNIANHMPVNIHRPNRNHRRGNTYSNDNACDWRTIPSNAPLPSADVISRSPFGEREWVDTYDSRCSTNRSKPPSWGSIELDKQSYLTPPPNADQTQQNARKGRDTPKYRTPDINPSHDTSVYEYPGKDTGRKLDTDSPRDSGIGSDEGPSTRHMTSSISPPTMKIRNAQKSLESLEEMDSKRSDLSSSYGGSNTAANPRKESLYLMSPPLTPPIQQTKLTPHIFVDISPKCNTTPSKNSRSSYPPCGQKNPADGRSGSANQKRFDGLPTPPPSGPNTPIDKTGRLKSKYKKDSWLTSDLDKRSSNRSNDSARLSSDANTAAKDTAYSGSKKERTWQASTLV